VRECLHLAIIVLCDIGDSDQLVEKELQPEPLEAPFAPAGIALVISPPAGTRPQLSFASPFMVDHVAWHAERLRRG
jgi:S-formylglutathione hydrolase